MMSACPLPFTHSTLRPVAPLRILHRLHLLPKHPLSSVEFKLTSDLFVALVLFVSQSCREGSSFEVKYFQAARRTSHTHQIRKVGKASLPVQRQGYRKTESQHWCTCGGTFTRNMYCMINICIHICIYIYIIIYNSRGLIR